MLDIRELLYLTIKYISGTDWQTNQYFRYEVSRNSMLDKPCVGVGTRPSMADSDSEVVCLPEFMCNGSLGRVVISVCRHLLMHLRHGHSEYQLGPASVGIGVRYIGFRHCRAPRRDDQLCFSYHAFQRAFLHMKQFKRALRMRL